MLAVYDLAQYIPLGGVGRDFPSLKMTPEDISHTSLVLLESNCTLLFIIRKLYKNTLPIIKSTMLIPSAVYLVGLSSANMLGNI